MPRVLALVLLVVSPFAGLATEVSSKRSVAAVEKVIQMLGDMQAKAKEEKNLEQVAFAEFDQWCKLEIPQTKNAIAKSAEAIESLTAEIAKLTSDAKVLGEEIAQLQTDVANYESEKKAAEVQRAKDEAAYVEESTDYGESVSALERAIVVLSKTKPTVDVAGTPDAAALLEIVESDKMPAQARSLVASFMGVMGKDFMKAMDAQDPMDYQAPEAAAYEFQSDGIVAMLKRLRDEFRSKLADCQKEEMNSKHSSAMVVQDLVDSIENSNDSIQEKTATKARKEEAAAQAKKDLAETIEVKKADERTLSDMEVECKEKQLSYTEKQQLRTEEIEAIQQAIKILKDPEVLGNAEKYLPASLAQKSTAFAALLRGQESVEGVRGKVREFLIKEGERLHSSQLSLLANQILADPFGKVKKMIDNMITRLLEEANADANHEGYCDEEIGKSKISRNKLTEDIDALTAAVEDGHATIMMLTEEIATLTKEVADLDTSMGEATKMRKQEKATNEQTVEDAVAAQQAVAAATSILKEFYEKASMATGLLQTDTSRPKMGTDEWKSLANPNYEGPTDKGLKIGAAWGHTEGMQTFGERYTGQQDSAGGVLAMLEVISSDFSNLEADTKAAEAQSQESYENFMAESKKNKSVKLKKIEMDETDKADAQVKLTEDTKDMKGTQDQLLAADRYYAKLVPQCFDKGMTYEERVRARESEIASLKEALTILKSQGSVGL
jgi:hypothetical protein